MAEDQHDTSIAVYSTLIDILRAIRRALATYLSELGPDRETVFFPDEVLQRLEARRSRRGTLSWSFDEERPLIDFAAFADLAELAAARPEVAAPFAAMAPNAQVLQVRLLELAAVSDKVTLGHGTVEQDLVMVSSFAQRLAQVLGLPASPTSGNTAPRNFSDPTRVSAEAPQTLVSASQTDQGRVPGFGVDHPESTPARPVAPASATPSPGSTGPATASAAPSQAQQSVTGSADRPRPTGPDSLPKVSDDDLLLALNKQDSIIVLRALYREIMTAADSMWTRAMIPTPRTWPIVRESAWYQDYFSPLGMRPVSDFYNIIETGIEVIGASAPRDKMQAFLTEHGFSQTLVALRDFFQRHLK